MPESQRYICTAIADLKDTFSFPPGTHPRGDQVFEVTKRLGEILLPTFDGASILYSHSQGNNNGKIRRTWTEGNKIKCEFECWDDILNALIAKGENRGVSLTHKPDWDNLENSRVLELSVCHKPMRPGCYIEAYHKGKPDEVHMNGDEWIPFKEDREQLITENDLHSKPLESQDRNTIYSPIMSDMEIVNNTTTTTSSPEVSGEVEVSGSSYTDQGEETKTIEIPLANPGETEIAYLTRIMLTVDPKHWPSQMKADLNRVTIEAQRKSDENDKLRQDIVNHKASTIDQILPLIQGLTGKVIPNHPQNLQAYVAAASTLDPAPTSSVASVPMSTEERVLAQQIRLKELEIESEKLKLAQAKASRPVQPQPAALASYQKNKQQQQNTTTKRSRDEDDNNSSQGQDYENASEEGQPNFYQQQENSEESQDMAVEDNETQQRHPQQQQYQKKGQQTIKNNNQPKQSLYEQNQQRFTQQQQHKPLSNHNAVQGKRQHKSVMATGLDPSALRQPGTIPFGVRSTANEAFVQAAAVLDEIPSNHYTRVINTFQSPHMTALYANMVRNYAWACENPQYVKPYGRSETTAPWEKEQNGLAENMIYMKEGGHGDRYLNDLRSNGYSYLTDARPGIL